MKPRYRMALGMFLLVVLAGGLSAAIFVVQGSQAAVYAQIAVVPLLVLAGYVWVNRTVRSAGTTQTEFQQRKAREVGESFSEVWNLAQKMQTTHGGGGGLTTAEWDRLRGQADELAAHGVAFDTETGRFSIEPREVGSLEALNRLETEVRNLDEWLRSQFTQNVRDRVATVNDELRRLEEIAGDTETVEPSSSQEEPKSWRESGELLDECFAEADRIVEDACQVVENAATHTDGATPPAVENRLSDARRATRDRQYRQAVTAILEAQDTVQREGTSEFQQRKEELQRLLDTAAKLSFDHHVGPRYDEEFGQLADELTDLDDALGIAELQSLQQRARETCLDLVAELQDQLGDAVASIENADVPEGWYEKPEAVGTDHVEPLRADLTLAAFRTEWNDAVTTLLDSLETIRPKASVVSGYDRIESTIRDQLRATGTVTAADLPVSEQEEQFLGLYYRKHMSDVEFDPDEPRLTAVEGGEEYDVHVAAAFPEGGEQREISIELDGEQRSDTVRRETLLAAEATFTEVPFGEYTVRVVPTPSEYGTASAQVVVDGETKLDLEIPSVSLKERLCDGVDVDVESVLPRIADRFESRFEEEGYVDTEMSFPVDEEYVPCLLAVWATRNGYAVTDLGERVTVYKRDRIRKEIENVIEYNIEPGEQKTYDELRNNFLSAPVSDTTIGEIVEEASVSGQVTTSDGAVLKEDS